MEKIKIFLKTAGIYFVGNVMSKLIAFFLLPLYTNYLSPSVLGEYDYAVTILNFLAPVCFVQIWDAMFRFSFDYEEQGMKYKVVSNAFVVTLGGCLAYAGIFAVINGVVGFRNAILVFVYGAFVAVNYLYSYVARVFRYNTLFALSGTVNSLVAALCNIFLILKLHMGLESLYIAAIFGAVVQCLMIEGAIRPWKWISCKVVDIPLIKRMIRFSLPLCVATVSYWLLSGMTKVMIVQKLGTYENGIYTVTNKFSMLLNTVVSIFQFAWNELSYLGNKEGNRIQLYQLAVKYIFHFVVVCACGLILFSKIIFPYVIGADYLEAVDYLPIAVLAVTCNAIAGFVGTIYSTEKQTKYIFTTTVVAAAANLLLAPILTQSMGLFGAILALAVAFAVLLIGRLAMLKRTLGINVSCKTYGIALLFAVTFLIFEMCERMISVLFFLILLVTVEALVNRKLLRQLFCMLPHAKGEKK